MTERRVAVRGIVYKDGKILGVKHKEADGSEVNFWATPGGGLDPNESLIDGLHREMVEETGIPPHIGKLLFVQQFSDEKGREQMEYIFLIENADDYNSVDLAETTHGDIELSRCEFIDPALDVLLPEFLQTISIEAYVTGNKPVLIKDYLTK